MIEQQEIEVQQQAERRQPGTDAQGSRVAHDDLGRRGVPPQEADAGAGEGHRNQGKVDRRGREHVVDGFVAEDPVPHDGEDGEAERPRTSGQPVHPVGDVHRIRRADHDEDGEDDPTD